MQFRLLLLALLGFLPQDDGGTKFKLNVNQVIVPVAVSDAKGHRISGLRAEDFELLEDGVAQKVTSFHEGGVEVQAPGGRESTTAASSRDVSKPVNAAPAPSPATEQIGRTYAICVDTLHSNFPNFPPVRT